MKKNPWLRFVARRFSTVDTHGRSAVTSFLSLLGIAFGVMTLIIVLGVMNGFQQGYITSILEVNSGHIRVSENVKSLSEETISENLTNKHIIAKVPMIEIQGLMTGGPREKQAGVLLRGVPANILELDSGFAEHEKVYNGVFSLEEADSIVLGCELAANLSVRPGDSVKLVALAGSSDIDLFPEDATFFISATVKTGNYDLDSTFAFVNIDSVAKLCSDNIPLVYSLKLDNREKDVPVITELNKAFSDNSEISIESWRSFNRAFFGALKVEKNAMLFLVFLIFVVVGVNIYHGMRRSVLDRKEEIAVLSSLGASPSQVRTIFLMQGLRIGVIGSLLGLMLGLLIGFNIDSVISIIENVINAIVFFFSSLITGDPGLGGHFSIFGSDVFYMDKVPCVLFFDEVLVMCFFGVAASVFAAWASSSSVLNLKPVEVLQYE